MKAMPLHTVIRQKDRVVFEGEVESLSSTNAIGPFDILPEHTHFIGLIEKYLKVRVGGEEQEWPVDRGVVSVRDGVIEVYLGY